MLSPDLEPSLLTMKKMMGWSMITSPVAFLVREKEDLCLDQQPSGVKIVRYPPFFRM
jgi:hypothetical protein